MKKIKRLLLSAAIVITLVSLYTIISTNPLYAIRRRDSNYYVLKNAIVGCQSEDREIKERKAVLRIDDPHAFYYDDLVFKMVDDAVALDVPVVLGVIPKGIGEDKELVTFLKHNLCKVEIALHGWDHSTDPPEFRDLSEEEAFQKMSRGKWVLETVLEMKRSIITFIAPENEYSEGT